MSGRLQSFSIGNLAGNGGTGEVAYWSNGSLTGSSTLTFDGTNLITTNLEATGQLAVGSNAVDSNAFARIGFNSAGSISGANQQGMLIDVKATSGCTNSYDVLEAQPRTSPGVYTISKTSHFRLATPFLGASSVIGTLTGFFGVQPTLGSNNAFLADNNTYSGNFFLNQSGTNASVFGGPLNSAAAQTTLTATGTAICSQPLQGSSWKKVVVYLSGYTDTAAQVYTFPTAFSHTPFISGLAAGVTGATVTTTTIAFTATNLTGFVFAEGY
jgi:hypothetical protein